MENHEHRPSWSDFGGFFFPSEFSVYGRSNRLTRFILPTVFLAALNDKARIGAASFPCSARFLANIRSTSLLGTQCHRKVRLIKHRDLMRRKRLSIPVCGTLFFNQDGKYMWTKTRENLQNSPFSAQEGSTRTHNNFTRTKSDEKLHAILVFSIIIGTGCR